VAAVKPSGGFFSCAMTTEDKQFDQFQRLIKKHDLQGVQQLVEAGVDVNVQTPNGWTPLMLAAWKGCTPIMEYLLSVGAETGAVNASGESAIALAALEGHWRVVQVLLNAGAPVDIRPRGQSLLEYVGWGGGTTKTSRHIELLRAAGAE
jgi:ankyrin repeat protein